MADPWEQDAIVSPPQQQPLARGPAQPQRAATANPWEQDAIVGGTGAPMARAAAPAQPPAQQSFASNQPRGVRNNNPGNIEDGPFARSLPGYAGSDGRFARFETADAGDQAKARLLGSYLQRGFNTPAKIINRWAPPSENDTNNYAQFVANKLGIDVNAPVTEDMIPVLASAIYEMENGQPAPSAGSETDMAYTPDPSLYPDEPEEVVIDQPEGETFTDENGFIVDTGTRWGTEQNPWTPDQLAIAAQEGLNAQGAPKAGDWVQYQNEKGEAWLGRYRPQSSTSGRDVIPQQSGVNVRETGALDSVGAFATGAAEQIPFLDESVALSTGLLTGEGYSAARQRQRDLSATDRATQPVARNAGGIAGFGLGFLAPGSSYIGQGANAVQRTQRAAQVGAIGGGLYGAGAADDSYASRLGGLAMGAAVGGASGGLLQSAANRLSRPAINSVARPSQARQLSRAGVELTPGQMASEIPVIGPALRALEEGASSIPIAGSAIAGARQRGTESFNRTIINKALEPIGEVIPDNVAAGYESIAEAQRLVSRAYDDVLRDVELIPNQELYDGLGRAINQAVEQSGAPGARRVAREIQERVFRYLGDNAEAPITGDQFKALESEFTTLAGNALNATDGATQAVGRAYQAVNAALRDALEQQNPGRREALRNVNEAYARLVRPETAAASSASQAADGVFSPTQLGVAVASQSGRRASARGDALMGDLVPAARGILNSRIGDSGTATRGAVTALASGAAGTAAVLNPTVAVPVIVGVSAAYSRPAQRVINQIYRATDNPGASRRHLARLASLAQRDPAIQPYYQDAVRFVTQQESVRPETTGPQTLRQEQRQAR